MGSTPFYYRISRPHQQWQLTSRSTDNAANARAERNNRTMLDDARTLLLQSGLRFKHWTYAVRAAADIRNMTYNKKIGTAPLLLLSFAPRIINLVNFIPFGADAIVWQPTDHKLQPRGIRGTILCRDPNSFGYFVLLHKENKIISARNFRIPNLIFEKGHIDKMLGDRDYDEECDIIEQEMRVPGLLDDEVSSEEDIEPFYPPDNHNKTAGIEHGISRYHLNCGNRRPTNLHFRINNLHIDHVIILLREGSLE